MKNTRLAVVLFACMAMLCIAATNVPTIPLDLLQTPLPLSVGSTTNVPIHVLPVVQQPQDQLSQYLVMLIAVAVPVFLDWLKLKAPNLPSVLLPALAPVLGALADLCMQATGMQTGGTLKGALLGSAGVGLRELANQIIKWRQQSQADPAPQPAPQPQVKPADPLAPPTKPA